MWARVIFVGILLQATNMGLVESAKQQVQLSDSYLPVAMQVIAHLTDQMAFEVKDEPVNQPAKPTAKPTKPPTNSWPKPTTAKPANDWPVKPVTSKPVTSRPVTSRPVTSRPVTSKPYVFSGYIGSYKPPGQGWSFSYYHAPRPVKIVTSKPMTPKPYASSNYIDSYRLPEDRWSVSYYLAPRSLLTTPFHRPGLFAPVAPPKPSDRNTIMSKTGFVLLPFDYNTQYTVIEPEETKTDEPLLSIQEEEVKPLIEPAKDDAPLLPPHFDADLDKVSRSDVLDDELIDENLQYLSENVREMIKMANDPNDERVIDVWEGVRAGNQEVTPKGKLSSSNLRLLLLYDLLSREAKRLRLSDYSGFSPDVMKALVESSSGGARAQLSMALAKMVERRDCEHEYANNRAKEMVAELAKDESKLSSELRYLQPLVFQF